MANIAIVIVTYSVWLRHEIREKAPPISHERSDIALVLIRTHDGVHLGWVELA